MENKSKLAIFQLKSIHLKTKPYASSLHHHFYSDRGWLKKKKKKSNWTCFKGFLSHEVGQIWAFMRKKNNVIVLMVPDLWWAETPTLSKPAKKKKKRIVSTWMEWNWLKYVHGERSSRNEEEAPPSEDANVSPSSDGTCRALSRSLLLPTWSRLQITGQDVD